MKVVEWIKDTLNKVNKRRLEYDIVIDVSKNIHDHRHKYYVTVDAYKHNLYDVLNIISEIRKMRNITDVEKRIEELKESKVLLDTGRISSLFKSTTISVHYIHKYDILPITIHKYNILGARKDILPTKRKIVFLIDIDEYVKLTNEERKRCSTSIENLELDGCGKIGEKVNLFIVI